MRVGSCICVHRLLGKFVAKLAVDEHDTVGELAFDDPVPVDVAGRGGRTPNDEFVVWDVVEDHIADLARDADESWFDFHGRGQFAIGRGGGGRGFRLGRHD